MTNFENEKLKRYFIKNHISKEAFQNIFQISQNIFQYLQNLSKSRIQAINDFSSTLKSEINYCSRRSEIKCCSRRSEINCFSRRSGINCC